MLLHWKLQIANLEGKFANIEAETPLIRRLSNLVYFKKRLDLPDLFCVVRYLSGICSYFRFEFGCLQLKGGAASFDLIIQSLQLNVQRPQKTANLANLFPDLLKMFFHGNF
jgi:hypothetical protein